MDLKKAFDTVDVGILCRKLSHYGVRGVPLEWCHSYLSNRSQAVRVGESVSMKGVVSMGVPQGSILGPLLFLLYINDLPNISDSLTSILFADDTTLLSSSKELKDVLTAFSIELPKVGEWCAAAC